MAEKPDARASYFERTRSDWYAALTLTINATIIAGVWAWLMPLPVIGLLWLVGAL